MFNWCARAWPLQTGLFEGLYSKIWCWYLLYPGNSPFYVSLPLASWWPGHSFWSLFVGKQRDAAIFFYYYFISGNCNGKVSRWRKDLFLLIVLLRSLISGDSTVVVEISRLKSDLQALISRESEGSKIHYRVHWFEEDEELARYFLKLQHERIARNFVTLILDANNVFYARRDWVRLRAFLFRSFSWRTDWCCLEVNLLGQHQ